MCGLKTFGMEADTELADLFKLYNESTETRSDNNISACGSTGNKTQPDAPQDKATHFKASMDDGNINDASEENVENIDETDEPKPLSDKEAEAKFISWYEEICKERMTMLEAEENYKNKIDELEEAEKGYRKRIKELDDGSIALVQAFEQTQLEVKALRKKYEPAVNNDHGYHEAYNDVVKHRDRLVNSEKKYKQKIKSLEEEVTKLRNNVNNFDSLPQRQKLPKQKLAVNKVLHKANKLVVITGDEYIAELEKENLVLKYKLEKFEREMVTREEVSKSEITKTKYKSVKTKYSIERDKPVRRDNENVFISKKHSPPFLPKIPSASSGSLDDERSTSVNSLHRTTQTPGLMFGLSYREIYSRKDFQRTDTRYQSISKYIV